MKTSSNQGHVTAKDTRTQIHHNAPHHTLPWTAPKPHQKRKEKLLPWNFFNQILSLHKNSCTDFITSSLLYPSKAHRICSVKMAGYPWKDLWNILQVILIMFSLLCLAFNLGPELACSGGRGGWKYLKHFAWRRERSQWSLVFGLDISNLFARLFIYVFYFHWKNTRCVWGKSDSWEDIGRRLSRCAWGILDAALM